MIEIWDENSKDKQVNFLVLRKIIVFGQPILSNPKVSILHATQCSDTICSGPTLKIGKIPVYSANPWIESFAHIVHDIISQQRSILLPVWSRISKYLFTTCIALGWLKVLQRKNKLSSESSSSRCSHMRCMSVVDSKPCQNGLLVVEIVTCNKLTKEFVAKEWVRIHWFWQVTFGGHLVENSIMYAYFAGGVSMLSFA